MARTRIFQKYWLLKEKCRLVQEEIGHIEYMLKRMDSNEYTNSLEQLSLDYKNAFVQTHKSSDIRSFKEQNNEFHHIQYMISRLAGDPQINKETLDQEKDELHKLLEEYEKGKKHIARLFKALGIILATGAFAVTLHTGVVRDRRSDIETKYANATGQQVQTIVDTTNNKTLNLLKQIIARNYNISDPSSVVIKDNSTFVDASKGNPQSGFLKNYHIYVRQENGSLHSLLGYQSFTPSAGSDGAGKERPDEDSTMPPEIKELMDLFSNALRKGKEETSAEAFYKVYTALMEGNQGVVTSNSVGENRGEGNNHDDYGDER